MSVATFDSLIWGLLLVLLALAVIALITRMVVKSRSMHATARWAGEQRGQLQQLRHDQAAAIDRVIGWNAAHPGLSLPDDIITQLMNMHDAARSIERGIPR